MQNKLVPLQKKTRRKKLIMENYAEMFTLPYTQEMRKKAMGLVDDGVLSFNGRDLVDPSSGEVYAADFLSQDEADEELVAKSLMAMTGHMQGSLGSNEKTFALENSKKEATIHFTVTELKEMYEVLVDKAYISNDDKTVQTKINTPFERITAALETVLTIAPPSAQKKEENTNEDELHLEYLDKDFAYDLMSQPSYSHYEYRIITYIMLWAQRNNVDFVLDKGNVYLTKGKLADGEFYPCVTSHLDTVQNKQKDYVLAGVPLDLKTTVSKSNESNGKHKVSVDGMGIGADCRAGILISLELFKYCDKLKACFFRCEEVGCLGSKDLDKDWFSDVAYVIGWDSPDLNRAAWSCSGVKLFNWDFYEKHLKPTCDKWGLTKFYSEPFTDVKEIREKTHIVCMNFGNGGYLAHSDTEYIILEDVDHALGMGKELIEALGCKEQFILTDTAKTYTWVRGDDGVYHKPESADDDDKLATLGDNSSRWASTWSSSSSSSSAKPKNTTPAYSSGNSSTKDATNASKKNDEQNNADTAKYIVAQYERFLEQTKTNVEDNLKKICDEHNLNYEDLFKNAVEASFSTEITF